MKINPIEAVLKNKLLNNVIVFDTIESTNNYLINNSNPSGTVAVAAVQKYGKGKQGASWISARGGLWFSFIIHKKIKMPFLFVILSSVAVADTLKSYGVKPEIKWPNDVLVGGKKICGILIENDSYNGRIVTGVGINLNNRVPAGKGINAVSLSKLTGKKTDIDEFFCGVLKRIDQNLADIKTGRAQLISRWVRYQESLKGRQIKVIKNGSVKIYKALNVTSKGTIMTECGKEIKGEVFFL
ncbi:MAG: biotin--[acetyl-CoA-carboxylase] ligase [Candidatus Goldiibacteriota bacterium HGW-Goldbacteria-1]|nr:MAG: biotin--[acetyl-CoA-carboxylase] ligase [Candidatus Goldiibacteriota bacterium HGW-Goldbacteria-1]